ncbi:hypothetical protein MCOR27_010925 [Pyricularia oryzae]|uniref:Uncharacterized protein n=1 Tax=Pyricularia grisea TaxID=148305 RepID=A0ABQ8N4G3_PYRGI|nr:hypothetical protein MCOR01_002421 [Pyricularia oryzae]KAI6291116.1 hypothetical protein MCOR33_010839 [Pyricularia grisea]KAH9428980.1 hypothetical protein MCOR02_010396 [Pyricularia oryzae]KAI6252635.1 hypothetical protein MCOR19_010766 [Pyricularia oryzae]KAI6266684.1 hypothetical protein MCOR27_010925 [Pyricularia oryzae]
MYLSTSLITAYILAAGRVLASGSLQPRQAADPASFTKAISALVHTYLPLDVYARLTATVTALVPAAEATQGPEAILVSALAASPPPAWLTQAFGPEAAVYQSGLAQGVEQIRPGGSGVTTTTATDGPTETEAAANATSSSSEGAAARPTLAAVGVLGMAGLVAVVL